MDLTYSAPRTEGVGEYLGCWLRQFKHRFNPERRAVQPCVLKPIGIVIRLAYEQTLARLQTALEMQPFARRRFRTETFQLSRQLK